MPGEPRYKKALLFCDNSGADFVLGMIPFARELLRQGTDVCLVANSLPAINDITAGEMEEVVLLAARQCETLTKSLRPVGVQDFGCSEGTGRVGKLTTCASGSGSPCLDFRRISCELCEAAQGTDLIVLEGMGRAVHTNWSANFTCDTLKLAMIKNSRLAHRLFNGKIYDLFANLRKLSLTDRRKERVTWQTDVISAQICRSSEVRLYIKTTMEFILGNKIWYRRLQQQAFMTTETR